MYRKTKLLIKDNIGYRARGSLSIDNVTKHEMSIGQSNKYIICHEMP